MADEEWVVDRCSCGDRIVWTVTERGRRMPVNALPSADGDFRLVPRGDGVPPLARHLSVTARFGLVGLRVSHFARCPDAPKHRRRKDQWTLTWVT